MASNSSEKWFSRILELEADFLYLMPTQFHRQPLVLDEGRLSSSGSVYPFQTVISSRALVQGMGFEPGLQLKLGIRVSKKGELQARTSFLLDEWAHSKRYVNPGKLDFPFVSTSYASDFYQADSALARYTMNYAEGSLTYLRYAARRHTRRLFFAWLTGARIIYLRETLETSFTKSVQGALQVGTYKIHTSNQLYGGELGFVLGYDFQPRWDSWMTLKGGVYANEASLSGFLNNENGTVILRQFHHRDWVPSYTLTGEIGLAYRPLSFCELHIAYQGTGIFNVALASENISFSATPTQNLHANETEVISGLVAGLSLGF